MDGHTKREYAKNLLKELNTTNPGAKERMFTAITRANLPNWELAEQKEN